MSVLVSEADLWKRSQSGWWSSRIFHVAVYELDSLAGIEGVFWAILLWIGKENTFKNSETRRNCMWLEWHFLSLQDARDAKSFHCPNSFLRQHFALRLWLNAGRNSQHLPQCNSETLVSPFLLAWNLSSYRSLFTFRSPCSIRCLVAWMFSFFQSLFLSITTGCCQGFSGTVPGTFPWEDGSS